MKRLDGRPRSFPNGRVSPTPETRARISAALQGNSWPRPSASRSATMKARWKESDALRNPPVKGECVYCGKPATERDHVIPRGRGGVETVLACHTCNDSKGQRTPDEWLAAGLYSKVTE